MGNKASRRRADATGVNSSKKSTGAPGVPAVPAVQLAAADPSDKGVSCPDLSAGAVPYREHTAESKSGPRHVNYTVYRSYSNVAEAARRSEPRPDIRFPLSAFIHTNTNCIQQCNADFFRLVYCYTLRQ